MDGVAVDPGSPLYGSQGSFLAYGSRTNSTLVAPSGITDDDLLIAFLVSGGAGAAPAVTPPAGWAEMTGSPTLVNDGSFFVAYHIYYKVAAGEAGDYAFTHAAGSSCGSDHPLCRGRYQYSICSNGNRQYRNRIFATALGLTTTDANTSVIFTEHDWGANASDTLPPFGTERVDTTLIYVSDGVFPAIGATGNQSHTCNNGASDLWGAYLIALKTAP